MRDFIINYKIAKHENPGCVIKYDNRYSVVTVVDPEGVAIPRDYCQEWCDVEHLVNKYGVKVTDCGSGGYIAEIPGVAKAVRKSKSRAVATVITRHLTGLGI